MTSAIRGVPELYSVTLLCGLSFDHYNPGRGKYIQYSLRPLTRIRTDIDDHRRDKPQLDILKKSSVHPVGKHVEQKGPKNRTRRKSGSGEADIWPRARQPSPDYRLVRFEVHR